MDFVTYFDKFNKVKCRDLRSLLLVIEQRYSYRNLGITIVDLGCNTGKSTKEIAIQFPHAKVYGIDSDMEMLDFASKNHKLENIEFLLADVKSIKFAEQVKNLMDSVDLVISIHNLYFVNKNFELIFDNIYRLLKPYGALYANFSIWADIFEIGNDLTRKLLNESNITAENPCINKPDRDVEIAQLKTILAKKNFGPCPEVVIYTNQIKFKYLKRFQDTIRCIFPLSGSVPDKNKLEFFGQFFERIYTDYFGARELLNCFVYDYVQLCCSKGPVHSAKN